MRLLVPLCLAVLPLCAQQDPALLGFHTYWLDRTASPCVDFYQFACGTWMEKHPIPADQSRWGWFNQLTLRSAMLLRELLDRSAREDGPRDPVEKQIGDHYAACMDEAGIEQRGSTPLEAALARIAAVKDKAGLAGTLAYLHRGGIRGLFLFYSAPDQKDSERIIAQANQGGLGLPDRDYYLNEDPKSAGLRSRYQEHIGRMFRLLGDSPDEAARNARAVLALETSLARASLDRVSRRDPNQTYHKLTRTQLAALTPSFSWDRYLEGLGAPAFDALNVAVPGFFEAVEKLIQSTPLEEWKSYLRWHLAREAAPLLSSAFVNENFDFFGRTLTGARQLQPRWKRCIDRVDQELGEALGRKYVERHFSPKARARTLELVGLVEKALAKDIEGLEWMTPATKKQALAKLHAVRNKIGYPDQWRDYSAVRISRQDAFGNSLRAAEFDLRRRLDRIGKTVDPKEWTMTPPTVNAYYSPPTNTINFPAGILQPPFFDDQLDDAVNFGGIGAVIGHELTHGFDDQGRKYDLKGNVRDWWTEEDAREFDRRAQCFVDQYGAYTAVDDVKLNGKLTLGENVADAGGVRLAYLALMEALEGKPREKIDGFTPEQRLFLAWGQVWCQNVRPEAARMRAATDPHSPGRYRVNGVVSNLPEFQRAFGCKVGQPMVREKACRVW